MRPIEANPVFPRVSVYLKISPLSPQIDGILHESMGNDFIILSRDDGALIYIPWDNIAFVVMEPEVNK